MYTLSLSNLSWLMIVPIRKKYSALRICTLYIIYNDEKLDCLSINRFKCKKRSTVKCPLIIIFRFTFKGYRNAAFLHT